MAQAVTDATFAQLVLTADKPVLVDFWAEWCGPCRQIAPIIDELATEFAGRADVYKLDIDTNRETPSHYNVMSIPTLIIFKGGQVAKVIVGGTSKLSLKKALESLI